MDNERGLNKDAYDIEKGIVQRAVHQIFEYRNQKKDEKSISIFVSFMQIYLNQITDLLDKKNGVLFSKDKPDKFSNRKKFQIGKESKNLTIENSLKVGHDKDGKIYVKGLSVKEAKDETSLLIMIEDGLYVRRTAETIMNKMSSRSHVILQITVRQMWKEKRKNNLTGEVTQNIHRLKGVLTIVDLAGSEALSRTGSEGLNQDEAKEINKSISALGRVIESLSRQSQYIDMDGLNEKKEVQKRNNFGSKKYVSYRDSKLTEILSECLGGNSKTYIVANVSPFAANCEETYSTLQFASRAMIIRTSAKKNEKISSKKMNKDNQENDADKIYQNLSGNNNPINANKKGMHKNNSDLNKNGGLGNVTNSRDRMMERSGFSKLFLNEANYKEEEKIMEGKKEDYQGIAEKFYSIILHLQEELGKITVQNYTLEQENNYLREQLRNII